MSMNTSTTYIYNTLDIVDDSCVIYLLCFNITIYKTKEAKELTN